MKSYSQHAAELMTEQVKRWLWGWEPYEPEDGDEEEEEDE